MPHRFERVRRLAALRDRNDQGVPVQHRVAITELARHLDFNREPAPALDRVLPDETGVIGRATGNDEDLVELAHVLIADRQLVQPQPAVEADATTDGFADRLRLLLDLLEHEVVVAGLLGGGGVPVDVEVFAWDLVAVEVRDAHATST